MRSVDSAVLIAAVCGIWAELAVYGIIAGILAMIWLWRAITRRIDNKNEQNY